jgi:broad specificity phosphatase PhoE
MRLILVRHGETACNLEDIWHGWDDCELTEKGHIQATAVGARLDAEPIVAVYSSDIRRALQTARAIAEPHGLEPILEPALRERNAGALQGLRTSDVATHFPTIWEDRAADLWNWRPPGGESFRKVLDRSMDAIERLRGEYGDQTVVAVSHMGIVRCLISHLTGVPLERTYDTPFPSTGVSIFVSQSGVFRPEVLNDASHSS